MAKTISSFLGANTPIGFVSFFDELYNPYENGRAFIIKGGPGTGKSGIMKKVASEARKKDLDAEYIYCSSDPDSLDGIILPKKGIAFADGTSPHILEPKFPGASENIINTGEFWDREKLFKRRDEIRALTLENSLMHRRSSVYLSAAGKLYDENKRIESRFCDTDKIYSFALRFTMRELKKISHTPGKKQRRFLSAISPKGKIFSDDTVTSLCHRIILIEDEYSAVSNLLIDMIGEMAVKNGYDVIFCYCPMSPKGECEHILIPEAGLALLSKRSSHNFNIDCTRTVHSRRFLFEDMYSYKKIMKFNLKLQNELIGESILILKKAKEIHDKTESIYIDAMDFERLSEYTQKTVEEIVSS